MDNRFFRLNIPDKLLQDLIYADWESMHVIVQTSPDLISHRAKAVDINGLSIEMSPLQYALRVNDIIAINLFKQYFSAKQQQAFEKLIEHHPDLESADSPRNKSGRIKFREMINQLKHHSVSIKTIQEYLIELTKPDPSANACYNLQPFLWVYEVFIDLNLTNQFYWHKLIGWAQWHLLPRHMLKQMCAGCDPGSHVLGYPPVHDTGLYWSETASFSTVDWTIPVYIYDCREGKTSDVHGARSLDIFNRNYIGALPGDGYALIRYADTFMTQAHDIFFGSEAGELERKILRTFQHLASVRHRQVIQSGPGLLARIYRGIAEYF